MSAYNDKPTVWDWLEQHATSLNNDSQAAGQVLPQLGNAGLFRIGIPESQGGYGGNAFHAVQAIARVAEYSLAAAFVFWSQRVFIEYLLQADNQTLREQYLPALLDGTLAGATGLSNAMKFLSGIENLQIEAQPSADGFQINGKLPWVTNLNPTGFLVAAAVAKTTGEAPAIVILSSADAGLVRSADLELSGMRGSYTAAIDLQAVHISAERVLHDDALSFCPAVRPEFLAFQCGMSLGLSKASLNATHKRIEQSSVWHVLSPRLESLLQQLHTAELALEQGLLDKTFLNNPVALFEIRIQLAGIVQQSIMLELEASGGGAYLQQYNQNYYRRLLESVFVPVLTPSLVQLQSAVQDSRS